MGTVRWKGGAAAVNQVQTFAMGGTWEVGDLIRVTVGSKTWDYAVTSTTITTFLPLFVTAYNALEEADYPEFAEMTASESSTTLTFTADTAGKPFTITLTPLESNGAGADAQTIEGAGVATTGTAATANSGPWSWTTAKNWDTGVAPVDTDDVIIDIGEWSILYDIAPSSIDLASLKVLVRDNANWTVGLPEINRDGTPYPEYRTTYLTLSTVTALEVRTTSGRVKLSVGSTLCTANVYETGRGVEEGIEALLWKGTNASNVLNVSGDSEVGVATLGGEVATVLTLRVEDTGRVRFGAGVTWTTANVYGGNLETNSAGTTITARAGEVVHNAGALTTATLTGSASLDYRSSGTLTTLTVGTGASVTFDADPQARTVTNCDLYAGASLSAENASVTFTNGVDLNNCTVQDVSLSLHRNVRLTLGTPA